MSVENLTIENLTDNGYPTKETMVELVNTDLLPFFEEHFTKGTKLAKVVSLVNVSGFDFIFETVDGLRLAVWESYFKDPEAWKTHRLATRKVS